jgi:hypothetical protein
LKLRLRTRCPWPYGHNVEAIRPESMERNRWKELT